MFILQVKDGALRNVSYFWLHGASRYLRRKTATLLENAGWVDGTEERCKIG